MTAVVFALFASAIFRWVLVGVWTGKPLEIVPGVVGEDKWWVSFACHSMIIHKLTRQIGVGSITSGYRSLKVSIPRLTAYTGKAGSTCSTAWRKLPGPFYFRETSSSLRVLAWPASLRLGS